MNALVRWFIVVAGALLPTVVFAQLPAAQPPSPAGLRIAAFSPQRAYTESPDGKAARSRLTALQMERSREIDKKNKDLASQEAALEQGAGILNEDARKQKAREVERLRIDVQRFIQDAQAELTGVQRDAEAAFIVKLRPIVDRLAKERNLQLVLNLDAEAITWFDPSLDITSEIVKRLASP